MKSCLGHDYIAIVTQATSLNTAEHTELQSSDNTSSDNTTVDTVKIFSPETAKSAHKTAWIAAAMVLPVFLITLIIAGALSWAPAPEEAGNPLDLPILLPISLALAGLYISLCNEDKASTLDTSGRTIIRSIIVFLFPTLYSLSCAFEVNEAIRSSIQESDKTQALSEGSILTYHLFSTAFWQALPQLDRLIFLTVAYLGFFLFTILYTLEKPRGLLRTDLIRSNSESISQTANTINNIEAQKLLSSSELLNMWSGNHRPLRTNRQIYGQWVIVVIRCLILGAVCCLISWGIQALKIPDPPTFYNHLYRMSLFTLLNMSFCVIQLGLVDKYAKNIDRAARIYIGTTLLLFPSVAIAVVLSKGLETSFPILLGAILLLFYYRFETVLLKRKQHENTGTPPYSVQSVDDFFNKTFNKKFKKQVSSIEASTEFSRSLKKMPNSDRKTGETVVYEPSKDSDSRTNSRSKLLSVTQTVWRLLHWHTRLQISRTIFTNYVFLIKELERGLYLRADSTEYHNQKPGGYVKIGD